MVNLEKGNFNNLIKLKTSMKFIAETFKFNAA